MTLILVLISMSASLSFAHIQQQRIQRNQLELNYLKTRMAAANKLDLFYIVLYDSPALLALATPCSGLELDKQHLVIPNDMMRQYSLLEPFYLCIEKEGYFNITIEVSYNDTERLIMERQIITLSTPWVWQPRSLQGF
ncbi:hypothetical protein HWV00_04115 [Moritella sp. 24]|uniref:hypothetical protein n=1 Tax=Moritella sp. 24 TaxID=2746230 RepID=UPI001BA459A7|nr:hypothetical protein [Moritella sp. 24]QUM75482.1 hypothetical protein HWV00_04115 [Moritella sp. 24]